MGIDHSNPYIHSTTVLCDITKDTVPFGELELTLEEYCPCKLHSLPTSFTLLPTDTLDILQTQLITTYSAINDRSGKLINVGDSIQLNARVPI